MTSLHRQQDSNVASCCGTVTSVLARTLGPPIRTVEKTAALAEMRRQSALASGDEGSSLGSPVTDDLDISDLASCRAVPPSSVEPAAATYCSELTVSNHQPADNGGWSARTDVTFRHRTDRLFYVDSAGWVHGPTDWRDRLRVAGVSRQEARRQQLQQATSTSFRCQHRQTAGGEGSGGGATGRPRILVQHRSAGGDSMDTRLSDLERCLDEAMASIRRGRLAIDSRSCAAGGGGAGSSDSLHREAGDDPRRRRRGNSEPPFEFAYTQRTATYLPAEVYEEVETTTMKPIGRGIQDLGSASRFVFQSTPQLSATANRRTATIAASTSATPAAGRRRLHLTTSPSSLRGGAGGGGGGFGVSAGHNATATMQHQQQRRRHQSANVGEPPQRQQRHRQVPPALWGGGGGFWRR